MWIYTYVCPFSTESSSYQDGHRSSPTQISSKGIHPGVLDLGCENSLCFSTFHPKSTEVTPLLLLNIPTTEANIKAHQVPCSQGLPATQDLHPLLLLKAETGLWGCKVDRKEWEQLPSPGMLSLGGAPLKYSEWRTPPHQRCLQAKKKPNGLQFTINKVGQPQIWGVTRTVGWAHKMKDWGK